VDVDGFQWIFRDVVSTPEAETMRTYNFRQCQELLQVDPKTFGRWLEKAKIDPSKQVNLADPRQKYLTEEQILMLAREHGREMHFPAPEQSEDAKASVTLATLDDRLTTLEEVIAHRFDQVEEQVRTLIADLRRDLVAQANITPAPREYAPAPTPRPAKTVLAAHAPARTSTKKRTKKGARAKPLPRALVPLSVFKSEHKVSDKAVEYALDKQKITVERGKWTHNNRNVMIALGQQGRHEFYQLFHEREGFLRCEQCPHAVGPK
jgi:hypothetical protein